MRLAARSNLVHFRSTLFHLFTADAMNGLDVFLLSDGFNCNKSHVGSGNGLADRFRIVGIVFVALHIRFNKRGRHQFDGMTQLL